MLLPNIILIPILLLVCLCVCEKDFGIFLKTLFCILVCTCVIHKRCKASVVTTCPGIRTCFEVNKKRGKLSFNDRMNFILVS